MNEHEQLTLTNHALQLTKNQHVRSTCHYMNSGAAEPVIDPCNFDHFEGLASTSCEPTITSEVHEIAAQVAAMEQLRTIQNPRVFNAKRHHSDQIVKSNPKKRECRIKLLWKHFKTIYTNNSPYGLLVNNTNSSRDSRSSNKSKPVDITDEENVLIAKQNRNLFPVGFYEMTCKTRGVTKGRGMSHWPIDFLIDDM